MYFSQCSINQVYSIYARAERFKKNVSKHVQKRSKKFRNIGRCTVNLTGTELAHQTRAAVARGIS
jgi:hypothetical protein